MLPLLVVATRSFSKRLFQPHAREPGRARAAERDGAGEPRRRARRAQLRARDARAPPLPEANKTYLEASLALARAPRRDVPDPRGDRGARVLVFFWYGGQLLLDGPADGGLSKGDFFAFWSRPRAHDVADDRARLLARDRPARTRRVRAPPGRSSTRSPRSRRPAARARRTSKARSACRASRSRTASARCSTT